MKDVVEYMAEICNTIVDIFNKFYAQTLRVAEEICVKPLLPWVGCMSNIITVSLWNHRIVIG